MEHVIEAILHSTDIGVIISNAFLAHVSVKITQAVNHDFHYIKTPKVWRSVHCRLRKHSAA